MWLSLIHLSILIGLRFFFDLPSTVPVYDTVENVSRTRSMAAGCRTYCCVAVDLPVLRVRPVFAFSLGNFVVVETEITLGFMHACGVCL